MSMDTNASKLPRTRSGFGTSKFLHWQTTKYFMLGLFRIGGAPQFYWQYLFQGFGKGPNIDRKGWVFCPSNDILYPVASQYFLGGNLSTNNLIRGRLEKVRRGASHTLSSSLLALALFIPNCRRKWDGMGKVFAQYFGRMAATRIGEKISGTWPERQTSLMLHFIFGLYLAIYNGKMANG